ncbi:MAG: Sec-independent protein translocase protein TatB [Pseudomonadota bacterium]
MFSIGFFELLLVGIIGLLILGPERLPGALREASAWVNQFRRYASDVRRDFEEQVDDLENYAALENLRDGRKLLDDVQRDLRQSISGDTTRVIDTQTRETPGTTNS